MARKIIYFVTEDWYFWSHRLSIARAARDSGYEVVVATAVTAHGDRIQSEGFRLESLDLRRKSANPLQEFRTLRQVISLYRRERPAVVHHVALKPVLYGGVAAALAGVPTTINALAGLGHLAVGDGLRARAMRFMFLRVLAWGMGRSRAVTIFQNPDDRAFCVDKGLVSEERAVIIRGSGVDPELFRPGGNDERENPPLVLMASRMLRTKGVPDFVETARELRKRGVAVRMVLAGPPDRDNPASLTDAELNALNNEGAVEYFGAVSDMPALLRKTTVAVLPSMYGEGVPKSLLEAASAEVALVAYDMPGCREIVRHGRTGLLVAPEDVTGLADAIERLIDEPDLCRLMREEGRRLVQREFAQSLVNKATLRLYEKEWG